MDSWLALPTNRRVVALSFYIFSGELRKNRINYRCQSIVLAAHQCDDRPVLENLLPRHEAEPEHVRQHKLPGGPVERPNKRDSDADEAVEVVRQRGRVSDAAGWADERYDEHCGWRVSTSAQLGT